MAKALSGKVVLITGAASGIGRATAIKLSQAGASLALTDVNEAGLNETASMTEESCQLITAVLDVSDNMQCKLVCAETYEYFSRIDHVFNCAGINPTAYPITDLPPGYFDKLVSVNLKGTHNVTTAALRHMQSDVGCTIVNVSSVLGMRPSANMAAYCATKYAIVGYTKALALELGLKGIRVNAIAPGFIDTPSNMSVVAGPEVMAQDAKKVAVGRLGDVTEVADVVVFLMSQEARYMNGSIVEINGGMNH